MQITGKRKGEKHNESTDKLDHTRRKEFCQI